MKFLAKLFLSVFAPWGGLASIGSLPGDPQPSSKFRWLRWRSESLLFNLVQPLQQENSSLTWEQWFKKLEALSESQEFINLGIKNNADEFAHYCNNLACAAYEAIVDNDYSTAKKYLNQAEQAGATDPKIKNTVEDNIKFLFGPGRHASRPNSF